MLKCEPGRFHARFRHMAGICRCARVSAPELFCEATEGESTSPTAVSDTGEFPVPVSQGKPDLEDDMRVTGWLYLACHPTERWQVRDRVRRAGRQERTTSDHLCRINRCGRKVL